MGVHLTSAAASLGSVAVQMLIVGPVTVSQDLARALPLHQLLLVLVALALARLCLISCLSLSLMGLLAKLLLLVLGKTSTLAMPFLVLLVLTLHLEPQVPVTIIRGKLLLSSLMFHMRLPVSGVHYYLWFIEIYIEMLVCTLMVFCFNDIEYASRAIVEPMIVAYLCMI